MKELQTKEELAAHYGPDGPVVVAQEWLRLGIEQDDFDGMWSLSSEPFRQALTEAWVNANYSHPWLEQFDLETLATTLAETGKPTGAFEAFRRTQLEELHENFDEMYPHLGAASRPRIAALDEEIVLFVDTRTAPSLVLEPTLTHGLKLRVSCQTGEWLVSGFAAPDVASS